MKTKAIRAAAKTYFNNRKKQKTHGWDKAADQAALFCAMREAGLTRLYAIAGTHVGLKTNKHGTKAFVVDIGDEMKICLEPTSEYYSKQ